MENRVQCIVESRGNIKFSKTQKEDEKMKLMAASWSLLVLLGLGHMAVADIQLTKMTEMQLELTILWAGDNYFTSEEMAGLSEFFRKKFDKELLKLTIDIRPGELKEASYRESDSRYIVKAEGILRSTGAKCALFFGATSQTPRRAVLFGLKNTALEMEICLSKALGRVDFFDLEEDDQGVYSPPEELRLGPF